MGAAFSAVDSLEHGCSNRPLCTQSTLFELAQGQDFSWPIDDTTNAVRCLKRLGFVILKDAFRDTELAAAESAIMPMIDQLVEQDIKFGNRGPNRMSASGFYANLTKQPGMERLRWNETIGKIMQEIFNEHGYEYGGAGADIAGPNSGYQWLHSDDNGSFPYSGGSDVRHRHWVPSMLMAHPVLEHWHNSNGPIRIIPWTAVTPRLYEDVRKNGLEYEVEKSWDWLNSWVPARRGDLILRDIRALHGGTPNVTPNPRIMTSLSFYNKEAVNKYPDLYKPYQESDASLPRFYAFDEQAAIQDHHRDVERYGVMKTL